MKIPYLFADHPVFAVLMQGVVCGVIEGKFLAML
jgi:hypothetical protein